MRRRTTVSHVNSELADKISQIEPGGNLCLFYDKDPAEQMLALIPFVQDALTCSRIARTEVKSNFWIELPAPEEPAPNQL